MLCIASSPIQKMFGQSESQKQQTLISTKENNKKRYIGFHDLEYESMEYVAGIICILIIMQCS